VSWINALTVAVTVFTTDLVTYAVTVLEYSLIHVSATVFSKGVAYVTTIVGIVVTVFSGAGLQSTPWLNGYGAWIDRACIS
jgi:hypothetical protein